MNNLKDNKNIKPFVKWAGGKRQFINKLDNLFPKDFDKNKNTYFEPFVGGGALFFHLLKTQKIEKAIINDINKDLITTYKVIRYKPNDLIINLNFYFKNSSKDFFNSLKEKELKNYIEISSRFIYWNKTGFNGLYRVNLSGKFNVPFASDKFFFNIDNIKFCSKAMRNLRSLKIYNKDYKIIFSKAKKGDFVFIDPPYDSDKKNTFNSYDKSKFGKAEQKELFQEIKKLKEKGVRFLFTNHDTELIRELYKTSQDFIYKEENANRFINSNASKRKNFTKEVFVRNYEI